MGVSVEQVRVGVATFVLKDSKVLLGQRIGSHGANTWALPGGHLEFGEEIEMCAIREVNEETGLDISQANVVRLEYSNDFFHLENKHYITLFTKVHIDCGEARLCEPDKCRQWQWFDWNLLPTPLFLPLKNYVLKQNNPFLMD